MAARPRMECNNTHRVLAVANERLAIGGTRDVSLTASTRDAADATPRLRVPGVRPVDAHAVACDWAGVVPRYRQQTRHVARCPACRPTHTRENQ